MDELYKRLNPTGSSYNKNTYLAREIASRGRCKLWYLVGSRDRVGRHWVAPELDDRWGVVHQVVREVWGATLRVLHRRVEVEAAAEEMEGLREVL